jgi:hypothetical protein
MSPVMRDILAFSAAILAYIYCVGMPNSKFLILAFSALILFSNSYVGMLNRNVLSFSCYVFIFFNMPSISSPLSSTFFIFDTFIALLYMLSKFNAFSRYYNRAGIFAALYPTTFHLSAFKAARTLSYALLNESLIFTSTFYIEVTFLC